MAVNVILNTESVRFPLTGIGRYTYELANALQVSPDIDSLQFFASGRFVSQMASVDMQPAAAHGVRRLVQKSAWAIEVYRLLSSSLRTRALKGYEHCIYHGPNFFLPRFDGHCVATFHDLSPFTWAHCHDKAKVRYMQKELRNTLDRADRLITDSEFTRRELVDFSGIPLDRIDAIPLASAAEFHPRTEQQLQAFLERYQLVYQGYTLYVGTIEPRKNLISLLDAYQALPLRVRRQWPLILAGYKGWTSEAIHARITKAEQEGWARYLGYLAAENLPKLFSGARLFAFPSHYEGFGLPVLEALSSGVPVVCSNSSSLPEVAGEAALMCEPNDVEKFTENLLQGLEDNIWRQQAVTNGLLHAEQFSWTRCANETLNTYRKLTKSKQ